MGVSLQVAESGTPAILLPAPRCCHEHDCCYQKLFDHGCHPFLDPYEYTIENKEVMCSKFLVCLSHLQNQGEGLVVAPITNLHCTRDIEETSSSGREKKQHTQVLHKEVPNIVQVM